MKRNFLFIVLMFIMIVCAGCAQDKRPRFKSLAFEFALKYNPSWEVKEMIGSAVVAFLAPRADKLDFFQETLTVTIQDFMGSISLAEYSRGVEEQTKAMNTLPNIDVRIIESTPMKLGRVPAHKLLYAMTQYGNPPEAIEAGVLPNIDAEGTTIKIMMVWTIREGKLYLITFVSHGEGYDACIKDVEGMLSSFQFL